MTHKNTIFLNCTIVNPPDDSSHHEIDTRTRKEIHKPRVVKFDPGKGLLVATIYPPDMRIQEGRSPLTKWEDDYHACVRRSLELDDAAVPFARWIKESPIPLDRCQVFTSMNTYAPKNLAYDIRKVAKTDAEEKDQSAADKYGQIRTLAKDSDLALVITDEKVASVAQERWAQRSFAVLGSLIESEDLNLANAYAAMVKARAYGKTNDVLKCADAILKLTKV